MSHHHEQLGKMAINIKPPGENVFSYEMLSCKFHGSLGQDLARRWEVITTTLLMDGNAYILRERSYRGGKEILKKLVRHAKLLQLRWGSRFGGHGYPPPGATSISQSELGDASRTGCPPSAWLKEQGYFLLPWRNVSRGASEGSDAGDKDRLCRICSSCMECFVRHLFRRGVAGKIGLGSSVSDCSRFTVQITNAVAVARILNVTLVIPQLGFDPYWKDGR